MIRIDYQNGSRNLESLPTWKRVLVLAMIYQPPVGAANMKDGRLFTRKISNWTILMLILYSEAGTHSIHVVSSKQGVNSA